MKPSPDRTDPPRPHQITALDRRPLPRGKYGRGTVALLILLRIYVVMAASVVGYAFFHALLGARH